MLGCETYPVNADGCEGVQRYSGESHWDCIEQRKKRSTYLKAQCCAERGDAM